MSDPFREAMVEAVRDKIDPEAVQAEIRTAVRALVSNRRLVSIKTAASLCDVSERQMRNRLKAWRIKPTREFGSATPRYSLAAIDARLARVRAVMAEHTVAPEEA